MTAKPKPPVDFDDNPPLESDFFATARPALEDPQLARVLARQSLEYRAALQSIIAADDEGQPLEAAIAKARDILARPK